MRMTRQRVIGGFGLAAATLVVVGATAAACTNLASLNLSTTRGQPGNQVTVTGSSFNTICICGPQLPPTPVKIRWNGINGEVMAEAMPDKAGVVSAAFTVPDVKPGYYAIVATQHDDSYNIDAAGTPARVSFEVLTADGRSVVGSDEFPGLAPSSDSPSSGLVALTIGLGVLGLALFLAGSAVVVRQVTARRRAVAATVSHD